MTTRYYIQVLKTYRTKGEARHKYLAWQRSHEGGAPIHQCSSTGWHDVWHTSNKAKADTHFAAFKLMGLDVLLHTREPDACETAADLNKVAEQLMDYQGVLLEEFERMAKENGI